MARPLDPGALLIVAIEVSEELHVTSVVISLVLPSEYVPVAAYCIEVPNTATRFSGVTFIETRVTSFTVIEVEFERPPAAAVTVIVPAESAEATPCEPAALLTTTIVVSEELQVALVVRS